MNENIILAMLFSIQDDLYNKNIDMKMKIEEYLDWIRYSETRYKKDYTVYKLVLESIQVLYVLKKESEVPSTLNEYVNSFMQH